MNDTKELKDYPKILKKSEVIKMYRKLPTRYVNAVIREAVISVNSTLPEKLRIDPKYVRSLTSKHIEYIADVLGDAPGYKPFNSQHSINNG